MPDMRLSEEEKKDFSTPSLPKAPKYPHGLRIHIDADSLKKLGVEGIPKVEDKVKFEADAMVMSVDKHEVNGDESEISISLQITDMYFVDKEKKEEKTSTTIMYGE